MSEPRVPLQVMTRTWQDAFVKLNNELNDIAEALNGAEPDVDALGSLGCMTILLMVEADARHDAAHKSIKEVLRLVTAKIFSAQSESQIASRRAICKAAVIELSAIDSTELKSSKDERPWRWSGALEEHAIGWLATLDDIVQTCGKEALSQFEANMLEDLRRLKVPR